MGPQEGPAESRVGLDRDTGLLRKRRSPWGPATPSQNLSAGSAHSGWHCVWQVGAPSRALSHRVG